MHIPKAFASNPENTRFDNPFRSFWMAGFECTDKLNCFGQRVDFLEITGHLKMMDEDFDRVKNFHIRTVREGIRWSKVEKRAYVYDWTDVSAILDCSIRHGLQVVWDICHFGFPDDLTPLHPMFARRFAALCRSFVQFYRSRQPDGPLVITPINEVSFLSWLGGDVRGTSPYCINQGREVKYALMRAYIEGVVAMKEVDPGVRILTTEPLVNIVPALNATIEEVEATRTIHESQFQSVDMLAGRTCPELGGSPELLDILGFNYYYDNQWAVPTHESLSWTNHDNDPRWLPLRALLTEAYLRYERPIALTETSHPGIDRPHWIRFITEEVAAVIQQGIPFWGVCLYPIIDRPDWDHLTPWHQAGLWDASLNEEGIPERVLYEPYALALRQAQQFLRDVIRKQEVSVA